jgi:Transglutaminase-like superfamily
MLIWPPVENIPQLLDLRRGECGLLVRAVVMVTIVRVALWTVPFRWLRKLAGARQPVAAKLEVIPVKRLACAVQAASRHIPGASCPTQALALQYLLARADQSGEVPIGVVKDAGRGFEARAWLTHKGTILIGNNREVEGSAPISELRPGEI